VELTVCGKTYIVPVLTLALEEHSFLHFEEGECTE